MRPFLKKRNLHWCVVAKTGVLRFEFVFAISPSRSNEFWFVFASIIVFTFMLLPLIQRHCINSQIKSVYSVSFRLLLQYLNQIQIQVSHFRRFLLFVLLYWHLYHNGKYVKEFWEFGSRFDSDFRVMCAIHACMYMYIIQCTIYICLRVLWFS